MTKVLAIAKREIEARAFVFLAAAVLTAVPFLALVVPAANFSMKDRVGAATQLGFYLASIFAAGVGILLGASIIGRETREKRLSFYFSRPVSGSSIWFGKLLAAAVLLAGSAAIMFIPPSLLRGADWRGIWDLKALGVFRVVVLWAGAFLLLAHIVSSMLRSRSLLLFVDFIAAIAFLFGLWTAFLPFLLARVGFGVASLFAEVTGGAICAVFVVAGAWQLSQGRTDVKRSHRQLSLALWCGLSIVLLATAAMVQWFISPTPADLRSPWLEVASDSAVVVHGRAAHRRDYDAAFLINMGNGAWTRVPSSILRAGSINDGGTVAVWTAAPSPVEMLAFLTSRASGRELVWDVARLQGTKWATKHRAISVPADRGSGFAIRMSPSGNHLAVLVASTVTIYDLQSGRGLGSARVQCSGSVQLSFIGEDSVIISSAPWSTGHQLFANQATPPAGEFVADRFDAQTHTLRRLVAFRLPDFTTARAEVARNKRELVVRVFGGRGTANAYRFFDANTGAPEGVISDIVSSESHANCMLHDGSVALMTRQGNRLVVEIRSVSGAVERAFDVGPVFARDASELPDGRLVLCVSSKANEGWQETASSRVLLLDRRSGGVTAAPNGNGIVLLSPSIWTGRFGQPATVFPAFAGTTPIAWNAVTGERRSLLSR